VPWHAWLERGERGCLASGHTSLAKESQEKPREYYYEIQVLNLDRRSPTTTNHPTTYNLSLVPNFIARLERAPGSLNSLATRSFDEIVTVVQETLRSKSATFPWIFIIKKKPKKNHNLEFYGLLFPRGKYYPIISSTGGTEQYLNDRWNKQVLFCSWQDKN
jgi:hypothetical protein